MDTPTLRKARGAFYTPAQISRYLVAWAIRTSNDLVLEPSCGEASFLIEAGRALRDAGASYPSLASQLHGVEIHSASADAARQLMRAEDLPATIHVANFFDHKPDQLYDALVGNPPYVRYQQHAGEARAKSLEAALNQGVRLNGLSSSWAPFVVHAASFLKPDGRLGLVLPAELLTVNYAAEVRSFLLRRFAKVRLIMFNELVFPGVLEEVVLLLAEGSGGATCFEVYQAKNLSALDSICTTDWAEHTPRIGEKWTPALLSASLFSTYQDLATSEGFSQLKAWGQTYLGAVTGANPYFAMTAAEAANRGLGPSDLIPISPPGSRHLRGLTFSPSAWKALKSEGGRTYLFYPKTKPSEAAQLYIDEGARRGISDAYKCTVRSPWWRVPLVEKPDLFLTYMNHDRPRLIANEAGVDILNSVYGVALHKGLKTLGRDLLPVACLNSVTLLGAEMVGRAYGGGLLKLEPREADLLPVPSRELIERSCRELLALKPQLASALRAGDLAKAVKLVDATLITNQLKVSTFGLEALRQARELLFQRRLARGKGTRGEDQ